MTQRLDRLRRNGELESPLPGVLCLPGGMDDFGAAILAGALWAGPDAVLTGMAAARVTFWPGAPVSVIRFATPHRVSREHGRWSQGYRALPPEFVLRSGIVPVTAPALTAVDLADDQNGGDVIDRALRSRMTTLEQMWAAFDAQPCRIGNRQRARLLRDSRDSPWSEGERLLHRLMRRKNIAGWTTNSWVETAADGYFVDVLFRRQRVIVEFDGWEFHGDRESFERDRRRRNELVLAGYTVLNFTWWQVVEDPDWVIRCIVGALAGR
ncbi:MAG TPA: DUF559 domain-containing protein [Microlunatus sp.]